MEKKNEDVINKLNLDVLKRLDHDIHSILWKSRYAALHELDRSIKIWHACEKAGPLFIVSRGAEPHYKFFLLNQKNNIDYCEEIFESMKLETKKKENFLFFETKRGIINGFWVSEGEDLLEIDDLIKKLFKK